MTDTAAEVELTPESPQQPQPDPMVRVKVFRNEEGSVVVWSNHSIPALDEILAQVPQRTRRRISYYRRNSIERVIADNGSILSFREWAQAIGAALMRRIGSESGATYESTPSIEPAYLAYGDTLFQLSPVQIVRQGKALAAARARIRKKMEAELAAERETAQMSYDALVREGQKILDHAEEVRRELETDAPVPRWVRESGIPVRWDIDADGWRVQMAISFRIVAFEVSFFDRNGAEKQYRWDALPAEPRSIRLWVPVSIDGTYAASTIKVDDADPQIPHVSHYSACLSPGDAPKHILSYRDWEQFRESVERCLGVVNLSSLLVSSSIWFTTFRDSIPRDLRDALKSDRISVLRDMAYSLDAQAPAAQETEEEIWRA